ncbi:hypothetical protein L7F22_048517 [Adiantum nelumboides]|nr:hypothetical protein [Adiantum nelumboides]
MSKGLWPCVTGTRILNLANPEDVEDDERAQAIIMLNLDKTLIHHVDQLPTSKEKWDELDKLYVAKGKNSKLSMKISLYALEFKPGVESLGAFISRMKGLMAQLASVQAPVDHEDAIAILLKSVMHVFPTLVTTLSNVPDLTWEGVIQSCLDEEKRHPAAPSTNKGASTSAPNQIFRLHGMPETIVSDRDPRFTSLFWKAIWENIGTRLQFSSSFHPQTNGQSEIANSVVLDLLKSYISDQKTQWERYLPLVEFSYNNTIHSSTGKTPFEIVEGAMKVPPFLSTKDKIFEADEYTRDLDTAFAKVRETLQKSQERQKKAADRHRRDLKLKENDWVPLRFEKARLRKKKGKERLYPKLSMRYYGPFQITERINDVSFQLRLPDTWKIHNAFHVSLLKPFRGDVPDDGEPDEQPEVEENEEILVPEQILAHKDTKTKGKVRRRFLVKFKNYPAFDAKWMEEEDLADTPQIVKLYLEAFELA